MTENKPTDNVGHKTFATGNIGPDGFPELRHEPLTRTEADEILKDDERRQQDRAERMPDEKAALQAMVDAYLRLTELGWRDAIYCPKDGRIFDAIEVGSTGIHDCHYQGEWPKGSWWIRDSGSLWPSRPVLYRDKK